MYLPKFQGNVDPSISHDKENFVLFLQELRDSFDAKARELNRKTKLLLTVAVSANEKIIDVGKYHVLHLKTSFIILVT